MRCILSLFLSLAHNVTCLAFQLIRELQPLSSKRLTDALAHAYLCIYVHTNIMSDQNQYVGSCNPSSPNFNWVLFLIAPHMWTDENLLKARSLSGKWTTCACGQAGCEVLPRYTDGEPKDSELSSLGMKFHGCIQNMYGYRSSIEGHAKDAFETLCAIEERASILIKQHHEQEN